MPRQKHYYGENHLHYLTRSTYHRTRLFDSEKFRQCWVETLGNLRRELGFKIAGYVLMPEHFHLLIWPSADANPSQILQKLEGRRLAHADAIDSTTMVTDQTGAWVWDQVFGPWGQTWQQTGTRPRLTLVQG